MEFDHVFWSCFFTFYVNKCLIYLLPFRFELAVQIGDLRVAYDIAVEAEVMLL